MPCLSSSAVSALKESTSVSNAESQLRRAPVDDDLLRLQRERLAEGIGGLDRLRGSRRLLRRARRRRGSRCRACGRRRGCAWRRRRAGGDGWRGCRCRRLRPCRAGCQRDRGGQNQGGQAHAERGQAEVAEIHEVFSRAGSDVPISRQGAFNLPCRPKPRPMTVRSSALRSWPFLAALVKPPVIAI